MLVEYYNVPELAYCGRRRYRNFSFEPFNSEEQFSIKLGDGATTSIKTSAENICNYVKIDNTRWFVISYVYLNGGQVRLNLQRDVIGEFGIGDCFGKVERGYTNSILKNRKELSLNQVLKKRQYLIPENNIYGNFSVNTHNEEAWGILYLVKPTAIDPTTNEPYPDAVNINIPIFSPKVNEELEPKANNTIYSKGARSNSYFKFYFCLRDKDGGYSQERFVGNITFNIVDNNYYSANTSVSVDGLGYTGTKNFTWIFDLNLTSSQLKNADRKAIAQKIVTALGNYLAVGDIYGYTLPTISPISEIIPYNYDNQVIKDNGKYLKYSLINKTSPVYGNYNINEIQSDVASAMKITIDGANLYIKDIKYSTQTEAPIQCSTQNLVDGFVLTYVEISGSDAGNFTLNVSENIIDEPYSILVFPLFNCKIQGQSKEYNIDKDVAFNIFNSVIQYLSGENSYIVDAQIYPYCPNLFEVHTEMNGYPFFSVMTTSYEVPCSVQLLPNSDVKKEYIEREYSIVSPDKTGKFTFNFYDYKNKITDENGVNTESLEVVIRTALKPFAIISSAVIIADVSDVGKEVLAGINYESKLNGSQSSSGGFECSLSSNQFEQYKRQNSNYQQLFAIEQEELQKSHVVEKTNEAVSMVVNTLSASAMGALAGQAMGDAGLLTIGGTKAAGAIAGSASAAAVTATAMGAQIGINEWARGLEEKWQQQRFDLNIATIKNLPNSVNRISSFNEIILREFWFVVETYECTEEEKVIVDNFIERYGYGIGVYDYLLNYQRDGWFLRGAIITSSYSPNLHLIAEKELEGGIYLYEQV